MTESQAWREVARRIAQGEDLDPNDPSLCYEYEDVVDETEACLWERPPLSWFDPQNPNTSMFWPKHEIELRVLAACFLAAIAEVGG